MTKYIKSFSDIVTMSGGSAKYVLGSNGLIGSVTANTPAYEYDANGTALGWLLEGARTNSCTYSADVSHANWTKTATITADNAVAPDGTTTADKVEDSDVSDRKVVYQNVTIPNDGSTWTASIYIKKSATSLAAVQFQVYNGTPISHAIAFDTTNGNWECASSIGTRPADSQVHITDCGTYYRVGVSLVNNSTGNTVARFNVLPAYATTLATDTPHVDSLTGSIWVWGAQVEAGAFPSSYIPTTSATVTRASDLARILDVTWLSQSAGSIYVEARPLVTALLGTSVRVLALTNASSDDMLVRHEANRLLSLDLWNNSAWQAQVQPANAYTDGSYFKFAAAWEANDFAAVTDGGTPATDTSGTTSAVNAVHIGTNGYMAASEVWFGHFKNFQHIPTRLPNSTLVALTT